jgi:hypothetical protein
MHTAFTKFTYVRLCSLKAHLGLCTLYIMGLDCTQVQYTFVAVVVFTYALTSLHTPGMVGLMAFTPTLQLINSVGVQRGRTLQHSKSLHPNASCSFTLQSGQGT